MQRFFVLIVVAWHSTTIKTGAVLVGVVVLSGVNVNFCSVLGVVCGDFRIKQDESMYQRIVIVSREQNGAGAQKSSASAATLFVRLCRTGLESRA